MHLDRRGSSIVVVRDDGSGVPLEGISLSPHHDYGLSNTYGSEIRATWGEAHLHRCGGAFFLSVTTVIEGCGGLNEEVVAIFRRDNDGKTWSQDQRALPLSNETVIAAITTHPTATPVYWGPRRVAGS
jgi:hypothetical protein